MSLQIKFSLLLGLIGLTVAFSLAGAWWSMRLMEAEVSKPLSRITDAATALGTMDRMLAQQDALLEQDLTKPAANATHPSAADTYRTRSEILIREAERLDDGSDELGGPGILMERALLERLREADQLAAAWFQERSDESNARARTQLQSLRSLIERRERFLLGETSRVVEFGRRVHASLVWGLLVSFGVAALCGALGLILVRRWVLRPVAALRVAAARVASGDFTHRVTADGGDELAALGREVNTMTEMVARLQEERVERERLAAVGEMVRRLAHNLRNPLAGIRGLAELSLAESTPDSAVAEHQSRIMLAVDRFERWLGELLSVSRPLNLHPEETHVASWITNAVQPLEASAAIKGVAIRLALGGAPRTARFDQRHLEQALLAIVSNAIEASEADGEVRVEAESGPDGQWRLTVTDNGPGVPEHLIDQIFSPYFTTKRDGSGIGLAFARQVVQAHGGTIEARSPANGRSERGGRGVGMGAGGAEFTIVLPLDDAAHPQTRAEVSHAGNGATRGEHSGDRGRGEPEVLHPSAPGEGRA